VIIICIGYIVRDYGQIKQLLNDSETKLGLSDHDGDAYSAFRCSSSSEMLRQRLFTVLVVTVFEYRRLGKLKLENFVMIE